MNHSARLAGSEAPMARGPDILVVGGYGVAGRRIAAHLARWFPGRVVIAGRDEEKAAALCRDLGEGSRARRVDVNDPASIETALEGVGTVMTCVAQRDRHLLRVSIDRGLAYTDIAPALAFWQGAEELHVDARRTGARVLLGAGLSPGISNMMARRLATALRSVERIETAIVLSLGDEYGPDSLGYVIEAATATWPVFEDGRTRDAAAFSEGRTIEFPAPLGGRTAYLFPWSDVAYYPKTLGAKTALGRFALNPPWAGWLISSLANTRARNWLKRPGVVSKTGQAVKRLERFYTGRDHFALVVTAETAGRRMRMSLAGRHQADATAAGTAELARALAAGDIGDAGVWLPEQVVRSDSSMRSQRLAGRQCWRISRRLSQPPIRSHWRTGST